MSEFSKPDHATNHSDSLDTGFPREEIVARVENVLRLLGDMHTPIETVDEVMQEVRKFGEKFKIQFPDWQQYRLFHILIGGSEHVGAQKFDASGKWSIEAMAKRLERKILQSQGKKSRARAS